MNELYAKIQSLLQESRQKLIRTVNVTVLQTYWQVGKYIVEYEQNGKERAGYGKAVINELSKRLMKEFGGGFTSTNLRYMRQLYTYFPIYHTLCDKLSWSHYRSLLKIQKRRLPEIFIFKNVYKETGV